MLEGRVDRWYSALAAGLIVAGAWVALPRAALAGPPPPGSPQDVAATARNAAATVRWLAPKTPGSRPITLYTVVSSPGAIRVTVAAPATVATVPGLTNGTPYTFTVSATSAAGTGPPSVPSSAVVPATLPGSPLGVRAVGQNASATITWTPPASDGGSPLTGYLVTASPGGLPATVGPLTTSALVSGLVNGAPYTFTVTAVNALGSGPRSLASPPVVPLGVPDPPTGVRAVAGEASATVTWRPPVSSGGGALRGYTVIASPGGGEAAAAPDATTAEVGGLLNGTPYTFTVKAANALGPGTPSVASNVVVPRTVPGPPGGVRATAGVASAMVTWTPPAWNGGSPITAYSVSSQPDGAGVMVQGNVTSVTIGSLVNGDSHTFTVAAANEAGTGVRSAPSNTVTPATPPGAPTDGFAGAGDGTTTAPPSGPSVVVGASPSAAVTTRSAAGARAASAPAGSVTPITAPGPPVGVTAVAAVASATVFWAPPAFDGGDPITEYLVTAFPGGLVATLDGASRSAAVPGLENGARYTFTVAAANAAGAGPPSGPSPPVIPATVPDPPTDLEVVAGSGEATVSWLAPTDDGGSPITGYVITASPDGVTVTVDSDASGATLTGLTNGIAYTFSVVALNAAGASVASAASDAVVPARSVPQAPLDIAADAGDSSATVSWAPPPSDGGSPITAYAVTVWPDGSRIIVDGEATSAILTGLINGLVYSFTVTASNALGIGPSSAPSEPVVPAAVPDMPLDPGVVVGDGSVMATWDPPASDGGSPIIGYTVTVSPGDLTAWVDGDTTTATLTGLIPGTLYTFAVTATNSVGTGPPSPSRSIAPAGAAFYPDYARTRVME